MRHGHDIRTSLEAVFVDDVTDPCRDIEGHLMLRCEKHCPKAHRVGVPMATDGDRVRWVATGGEILQEEPVFGCGSKTAVNEEERGFGCVMVGWCGTEELEVSPRCFDMSARYGRVEFDVESKVFPR
jgi:hypothetical protein